MVNYNQIEEQILKKELRKKKKKIKVSGKSVFKLQEIIRRKSAPRLRSGQAKLAKAQK